MNKTTVMLHLLGTLAEAKLFHWQTKMYAKHVAFGSFYSVLHDLADQFIEMYQGKYGRIQVSDTEDSILLDNLSKVDLLQWIKTLRSFFEKDIRIILSEEDSDLHNIADEMLGQVNKLAYFLTLE